MGTASEAPPPPDTSKYSDAAYGLGQKAQEWAQQMWDTGQQEWSKLQSWAGQVMGQAMPAMEDMFSWAKDQRDRYEKYAVPAMQSLFSDAETYASKAEEDRQRGAAIQDVQAANAAKRASHERNLRAFGVNMDPTNPNMQSLDRTSGVMEAGQAAFAANQAGERTKQIGRDLTAQAINAGNMFGTQAMQATQAGAGVGTSGIGAATGATVGGSQVAQAALPYVQGAYGGYDLGAGIVDTSYGRSLQQTELNNAAAQQNFNNMMKVGQSVGGMVPGGSVLSMFAADGGPVVAPGGPTDDAGAIAISNDEYIIPADVVKKLGTNYFDKMIEKETGRPPPSQKQAIPIQGTTGQPQNSAMVPQGYAPAAGVIR
jgi:hypothetical protein